MKKTIRIFGPLNQRGHYRHARSFESSGRCSRSHVELAIEQRIIWEPGLYAVPIDNELALLPVETAPLLRVAMP